VLFDRRHKPTLGHKVRNLIWPRAGLRRATLYMGHRMRRIPGTPYAIAAGFACGAAISMTPFPGLHFVLSALLAWGMRASIISSAIGTAVGNPWTFPFIWLWTFEFGHWLIGSDSALTQQTITLQYLWDHPLDLLLPMLVGSIPTAIVIWFAFYWPLKRMVKTYQLHRRHRLAAVAQAQRDRRPPEIGGAE
jgi:uncharacterized protein (DUF2062 family)